MFNQGESLGNIIQESTPQASSVERESIAKMVDARYVPIFIDTERLYNLFGRPQLQVQAGFDGLLVDPRVANEIILLPFMSTAELIPRLAENSQLIMHQAKKPYRIERDSCALYMAPISFGFNQMKLPILLDTDGNRTIPSLDRMVIELLASMTDLKKFRNLYRALGSNYEVWHSYMKEAAWVAEKTGLLLPGYKPERSTPTELK